MAAHLVTLRVRVWIETYAALSVSGLEFRSPSA